MGKGLLQRLKEHSNSIVSYSILTNSNNIFNLGIPGANVLIPSYLAELKKVVRECAVNSVRQEMEYLVIYMGTAGPQCKASTTEGCANQVNSHCRFIVVLPGALFIIEDSWRYSYAL